MKAFLEKCGQILKDKSSGITIFAALFLSAVLIIASFIIGGR